MSKECHVKRCAKLGAGGMFNQRKRNEIVNCIAQALAWIEICTKVVPVEKTHCQISRKKWINFCQRFERKKRAKMHYSFGLIKNSNLKSGQFNVPSIVDTVSNVNKSVSRMCHTDSQDSFSRYFFVLHFGLQIYRVRCRHRRDDSNGFNKSRPYHLSSHTFPYKAFVSLAAATLVCNDFIHFRSTVPMHRFLRPLNRWIEFNFEMIHVRMYIRKFR